MKNLNIEFRKRETNPLSFSHIFKKAGRLGEVVERPVICVQGLGFVGTAMAIAIANAGGSAPEFNVIGVDLPNEAGAKKVKAVNNGTLFLNAEDPNLEAAMKKAYSNSNLTATVDPAAFSLASVVLMSIHFDITENDDGFDFDLNNFKVAVETIGKYIKPNCLVIVETTVPPGTCEKVAVPALEKAFKKRGIDSRSLLLAHSYERVMPGVDYYNSIVNFWRVYSGHTELAADLCEKFLSKVINVAQYPLKRLTSTTASETAKVLENSYRAVNIAFIEEWGRFAETVGIDLFDIISAIRVRPTHSNIRQPGFGVGGYCLTKDPLFAYVAAQKLFGEYGLDFPFSRQAISINRAMPLVVLEKIKVFLGRKIEGKKIILLGVSYRPDVGDTRYSPSQQFVEEAKKLGGDILCHDPIIHYWPEMNMNLDSDLPSPDVDAIVFASPHRLYRDLDILDWLGKARPLIVDANNILTRAQKKDLKKEGCPVCSIGNGENL